MIKASVLATECDMERCSTGEGSVLIHLTYWIGAKLSEKMELSGGS